MKKLIQKMIGWYVDPLRSQCEILARKIDDCEMAFSRSQEQLTGHQEQLTGHQEQLTGHWRRIEELQEKYEVELQAARKDCDNRLEKIYDEIQRQLEQICNLQCNMQRQLDGCQTQFEVYQEQLTGHQEQLTGHQEQLTGHQEQLTGHQEQLTGHQEQLDRHQVLLDESAIQIQRTWKAISSVCGEKAETPVRYAMMPYHSLEVEGLTYLYHKDDEEIPGCMDRTGLNYSKYDIDNFLSVADEQVYRGKVPETGVFLDIGGNIGTTTIYCQKKKKPELNYIAFEPVERNARLFLSNCIMNGCEHIRVEKLALSNFRSNDAVMEVPLKNSGNSKLALPGKSHSEKLEHGIETMTLDEYLEMYNIDPMDIHYIWLDVEGHETEVLEGAKNLFSHRSIPTCMEYNQDIYKEKSTYEMMLQILQKNFDYFLVCAQYAEGKKQPRCISELSLLWEELQHRACDLILWK